MATYTDNFNRADSDSLGAAWSETSGDIDIASNAAVPGNTGTNYARYESDLSGAAQYCECVMDPFPGAGTHFGGPMVQFSSAATSGYVHYIRGSSNFSRVFRVTGGSLSQLGSTDNTALPSAPFTARLEVDADGNIEALINGVSSVTATDTTWAANRRCGMLLGGSTTAHAIDSWEAGDIGAAPASSPIFLHTLMGVG